MPKKGTSKETTPPEQENLFGEQDHVFNVLHTELTDINNSIEREYKKMEKSEKKIDDFESRKGEVRKAIEIVEKERDKHKPAKGKGKPEPQEKIQEEETKEVEIPPEQEEPDMPDTGDEEEEPKEDESPM